MTMVEMFRARMPEGMKILNIKDRTGASNAQIKVYYHGTERVVSLPKECAPGKAEKVCDYWIFGTMVSISIDRNDFQMAKAWNEKMQALTENV